VIGRTVSHYKIVEELGRGGMGVVYKAEDTKLKRKVALKFLLPHILANDEDRNRFIHEAQSAAALHHPNICTIYEINEADGQTFISMAYLEGESLNEQIGRRPLKPTQALRFALQIARGLNAAHQHGIIHRDIKSSNIMISDDGQATIMDFGLAKSAHQTHATQRGVKMGTIGYMSPEQTRGDPVDHRTDIWSLGVLLYEMIAGRRPFQGDYDEAVIYSILNEEPEPLGTFAPDAPEDIWLVIQRAIAKKPDDRYQTMAEMVEDLEVLYEDVKTGSSSRRPVSRISGIRQPDDSVSKSLFSVRAVVTLLAYLVFAWAAFVFTGWLVGRFVLSPHLGSIVLVGVLSLVPTVWILAARRGKHSRVWSLIAGIGIPANVAASVVVLVAIFAGRDIGAATKTVTVLDEAGRPIERAIPKSEYRKSLTIYFFDNDTGDDEFMWVGGALLALLQVDLFQDQFVYQRSSIDDAFRLRLQKAGFTDWFEAPWNLMRKIAEDAHIDYFVTGSYTREEDVWVVTLRLYETRSGRLADKHEYRNRSLFALIDEASVDVRRNLGLPEGHIQTTQDLPVAEMFTSSMPALRDYCEGIYLALFEQDWLGSVRFFERATVEDSTFAWGYLTLYQIYQAVNARDKADPAMRAAMKHSYRLPERMQFVLKTSYYQHTQDPEKLLGVVQMWVELYPKDIEARTILAHVRRVRNQRDLAIEQFKKVLEIDPSRTEFLQTIAGLYADMGDFDRAVQYYDSYLKSDPSDAEAYQALGGVYEIQGKYDQAMSYYEKALVLDPNQVRVLVDIGDVESKLNNDQAALKKWDEALALANTPQDRIRVYRSMRNFYSSRGQIEKAIEILRLYWAEQAKYLPPLAVQSGKLEDLCFFVWAGHPEEAFRIIESAKAQLVPPYDGYLSYGYLCVYVEMEDPDKIEEALKQLKTFIDKYGIGHLRGEAYWAEGEMDEDRGDYEAAIASYRRKLQEDPTDVIIYRSIGRCQRNLGQYEAAKASIEKTLQIYPNNAIANYEIALVYHEMGNQSKAMEHLRKALERWKDADAVYKPAQKARATLAQWQT
jgi:tetratricopeptide (TPR) repeat protein/tRNA A-37 threonylcarbamoyl transferase component Bud32/TolB-like protein